MEAFTVNNVVQINFYQVTVNLVKLIALILFAKIAIWPKYFLFLTNKIYK